MINSISYGDFRCQRKPNFIGYKKDTFYELTKPSVSKSYSQQHLQKRQLSCEGNTDEVDSDDADDNGGYDIVYDSSKDTIDTIDSGISSGNRLKSLSNTLSSNSTTNSESNSSTSNPPRSQHS